MGKNPYAMSTLEVLHTFALYRKYFLSSMGVTDSHPSTVIKFETCEVQPNFPYHVALLVHVECMNNTIKQTMIDEGVAASVMSLAY